MRLRLLIDVEWRAEEIATLAEEIADQPAVTVVLGSREIGGRLMGATPVQGGGE